MELEFPSIPEIVDQLNLSPKSMKYYREEMEKHTSLYSVEVFVECIENNVKLEENCAKKSPAHRQSFYYFASTVAYWWFNVKNRIALERQFKFLYSQQPGVFVQNFVSAACCAQLPISKKVIPAYIKEGLDAIDISVFVAFKSYPEFWGDPANFIDLSEVKSWPLFGRKSVAMLADFTKDTTYLRNITQLLYDDPSSEIRNRVQTIIQREGFPKSPPIVEEKADEQHLNLLKLRRAWETFEPLDIPTRDSKSLGLDPNFHEMDNAFREIVEDLLNKRANIMTRAVLGAYLERIAELKSEFARPEDQQYLESMRATCQASLAALPK